MPTARLITTETSPSEILDEFGEHDVGPRIKCMRAIWFQIDFANVIFARVRGMPSPAMTAIDFSDQFRLRILSALQA